MTPQAEILAERILMGLLLFAIAVGCWLVLEPFLSAIFWGAILVFTTWPVFRSATVYLHLRDSWGAVLIVLPIALAAPAGADDIKLLRGALEDAIARGLPGAPSWLPKVPLIGAT